MNVPCPRPLCRALQHPCPWGPPFRDTAHGFLAWAVATLVSAALLTSAIGSIVGTGIQAGASMAGAAASSAATGAVVAAASNAGTAPNGAMGMEYHVDSLFRKTASAPEGGQSAMVASRPPVAEVARIPEDAQYLGQVVAQHTGLAQGDAQKRVTDTFAKVQAQLKETEAAARDAADKARKTSAGAALWLFVSLLVGAFVASLAATYGGRRRDL